MGNGNYRRWLWAVACALMALLLVSATALGAMPWTRISKLLVEDEGYALGTWQVDGTFTQTGELDLTLTNAAGGSANPFDYTATAGVMDNSDDLTVIDINLTNANHTGTGNTVQAIDIAGITADAQATETAIKIAAGWDNGISNASATYLGAALDVRGDISDGAGAVHVADPLGITGTLKVTGNADFEGTISDATGAVHVADPLGITGTLKVTGNADFEGTISDATGAVHIADPLGVTGTLKVTGNADFEGTISDATGAVHIADPLGVTGTLKVTSDFDLEGTLYDNTGAVHVADPLGITGTLKATSHAYLLSAAYIGGGHGDTGCTVFGDGQLKCNGKAQLDAGLAVTGTVTLPSGEIGATEIADITRSVSVPLRSFIECSTDGGADINYTDGADAFPDFISSATDGLGFALVFDDAGGNIDTAYVCSGFVVPSDYASGGAFVIQALKDGETGANSEIVNCAISINGAALLAGGTATVDQAATKSYTCTPTTTALAAGNAVNFELHITSGGTVDDAVSIQGVAFTYTATQ